MLRGSRVPVKRVGGFAWMSQLLGIDQRDSAGYLNPNSSHSSGYGTALAAMVSYGGGVKALKPGRQTVRKAESIKKES